MPTPAEATKQLMRERMQNAAATIGTAVMLLKSEMAVFDQYLKEAELMDSVGPTLAPGLFVDPERRAVDALMRPLFRSARNYVRDYDAQCAAAKAALAKVSR